MPRASTRFDRRKFTWSRNGGPIYPDLPEFIDLFKKRASQFRLCEVTEDDLMQFTLQFITRHSKPEGALGNFAFQHFNGVISDSVFRTAIVSIMYSIGFLGIKTESYTGIQFVGPESGNLTPSEISDDCLSRCAQDVLASLGHTPQKIGLNLYHSWRDRKRYSFFGCILGRAVRVTPAGLQALVWHLVDLLAHLAYTHVLLRPTDGI